MRALRYALKLNWNRALNIRRLFYYRERNWSTLVNTQVLVGALLQELPRPDHKVVMALTGLPSRYITQFYGYVPRFRITDDPRQHKNKQTANFLQTMLNNFLLQLCCRDYWCCINGGHVFKLRISNKCIMYIFNISNTLYTYCRHNV